MGLVMTSDGRLENEGAAARLEEGVVRYEVVIWMGLACGDRYHYDPRAPTPAVGGTSFNAKNCGEMLQDDFERNRLIIGDLIVGLHGSTIEAL